MDTPYFAVIFTSIRTEGDNGYSAMADAMEQAAQQQPGYIGMDHARSEMGITISYWHTLEDIKNWKAHTEHMQAQMKGRNEWYAQYKVRICKVEREYEFTAE